MMSKHVVFLHYHGIGHINPCFPLARILEARSYKVTFAGVGFFQNYIKKNGFDFYPFASVPFGLGFERWANSIGKPKNLYLACLKDRITDGLYRRREAEIRKMLDALKPDIVLLDGTQATDFIVLYPALRHSKIKIGIIHAMFPTFVMDGRPPVNSTVLPGNTADVDLAIGEMQNRQSRKMWLQRYLYLWHDDRFIVDRRFRRNKVPASYRSGLLSLFYFSVANVPELILAPREFDFPTYQLPANMYFTGFKMNPVDQNLPDNYVEVKAYLQEELAAKTTRLIYCSFGTIESEHNKVITDFLDRLISVVEQLDYRLIVSTGSHKENKIILRSSDNVWCFASVPQTDVLTFADIFITHGGLSSIKESIHAGVPMLMYPVHGDYDPIGNAARVEYHEIGLRGDAATDGETIMMRKIKELVDNPKYIRNVRHLRETNEHYVDSDFVDLIENLHNVV